jgi:glycine cleavage system pyridoxal-binding protein P
MTAALVTVALALATVSVAAIVALVSLVRRNASLSDQTTAAADLLRAERQIAQDAIAAAKTANAERDVLKERLTESEATLQTANAKLLKLQAKEIDDASGDDLIHVSHSVFGGAEAVPEAAPDPDHAETAPVPRPSGSSER